MHVGICPSISACMRGIILSLALLKSLTELPREVCQLAGY